MYELADFDKTTGHLEGCPINSDQPDPDCTRNCAKELRDLCEARIGAAWDAGWETAAACYWHKPKNPLTGEMNDDANDYCPDHGGIALPEHCNDDSHPVEEPPDCTCGRFWLHTVDCPRYIPPITLPEVKVTRGGIRFGTTWNNARWSDSETIDPEEKK